MICNMLGKIKNNYNKLLESKYIDWTVLLSIIFLIIIPVMFGKGYIMLNDLSWGPNPLIDFTLPQAGIYSIFKTLGFVVTQSFSQVAMLTILLVLLVYFGYRMGGLSVAVLAILNPFVYDRFSYGQMGVLYGYAFLLAMYGLFVKILQGGFDNKNFLLLTLYFSLSVFSSPHYIFISSLSILFFISFLILSKKKIDFKKIFPVKNIFYSLTIFLTINLLWIYNLFFKKSNYILDKYSSINTQNFDLFLTSGKSFIIRTFNLLNLQGFWIQDHIANITLPYNIFIVLIIYLLFFYFLFKIYQENRKLAYLVLLFFIGLVLLAQSNTLPFSGLIYSLPMYGGMREPQKWMATIVCLILFIYSLYKEYFSELKLKISILFLGILWTPFMFWGFWGDMKKVEYPDYYKNINNTLNKNNCFNGDIVIMPWHWYIRYSWMKKRAESPDRNYFDCLVITGKNIEFNNVYDESGDAVSKSVSDYVLSGGVKSLPENVKALVLIKDPKSDYNLYNYLSKYNLVEDTENYTIYRTD